MAHTWRDSCRPIIAKVIDENHDKPLPDIRAALRQAYPYGQREYHPYRIWCDEVRKQLRQLQGKRNPAPPTDGLFNQQ